MIGKNKVLDAVTLALIGYVELVPKPFFIPHDSSKEMVHYHKKGAVPKVAKFT